MVHQSILASFTLMLSLTRPDDFHVHLREGEVLANVISEHARHFNRVLAMPNLRAPLTTLALIESYREQVKLHSPSILETYFTFFLNPEVRLSELKSAKNTPYILGAKLYPQGVTTQSDKGTEHIEALYDHFDCMQDNGLVLQIHGETQHDDIFDREASFVEQTLSPIVKNFPKLKIILEHTSTKAAVDFVVSSHDNVAATITPQHLLYNRNDLLSGGIKPHLYCLPILKRQQDQEALLNVVKQGNAKFFLGTDSAPHAVTDKESACGCAGVYSAPYALPLYAEIFESLNALDKLEGFASHFGADFYELKRNNDEIHLEKRSQVIPETLPFGSKLVRPIKAGETINWSVTDES